jgi:hypothetical protein
MKSIIIVALIACLGIVFIGCAMTVANPISSFPLPPPPPLPDNLDANLSPLDSLADSLVLKCIALGVVDTTKPIQNEDGIRCAKVLCGEETANADFPEAEGLIRECYERHFPKERSLSGQPNWGNPKCYEIDRIENELHKKWKAENDDRYVVAILSLHGNIFNSYKCIETTICGKAELCTSYKCPNGEAASIFDIEHFIENFNSGSSSGSKEQ